ncbi:hypothetical protein [Ralstonia pseudosolanacearum]|uniref:hypothetical protein n=1 Tax=Ralstonia pseudosolanacearum TaxID=1310165 RepID=UPI003CFA4187
MSTSRRQRHEDAHGKESIDSIHTDAALRGALHSIYVAQFNAIKACEHAFDKGHATRMLTGLMGSRPWSWRVIGITPAALEKLAKNDYERPTRELQRGHIFNRSDTAKALYIDSDQPFPLDDFFKFFLERDKTVIMINEENPHRAKGDFPAFIEIDERAGLFPCGSLIGWQHRPEEKEFLRDLYEKQGKGDRHS